MASAILYKMSGTEQGQVDLIESIFGVEPNHQLVHEVAVALMNAKRQGNAETKTRSEVRGGGTKPFRQKGTGRARQGSTREPQMRGGGTVFGPHKRSYRQKVTTVVKRKALCCVLSDRARKEKISLIDSITFDAPKTKPFAEMIDKVAPEGRKTLVVLANPDKNILMSARNIANVTVTTANDMNALDVLDSVRVVMVQDALTQLEERLS